MTTLLLEIRQAIRAVRRMRGGGVAAVGVLAIGIAATTTVGSLAYGVFFRPLPFPQPQSLVELNITRRTPTAGLQRLRWSYAKIAALEQSAHFFEQLAAFTRSTSVSVAREDGAAEQMSSEIVSASYFDMLRTRPLTGQTFQSQDDTIARPVAVASEGFWHRLFPAETFRSDVRLRVNGETVTVIGVMPEGFQGLGGQAQLWLPLGMAPVLTYRDYLTTPQHFISLVGRLKPDVSIDQTNAELAVIGPTLVQPTDSNAATTVWSAAARPLAEARIDANQARSARLLLAAVIGVLLVTCLNVTTVLLMRARVRARELAMRVSLGASRRRIVSQWLIETAIIVTASAVIGLLLSVWGISWLRWMLTGPEAIHTGYVQIDPFSVPRFDAVTFVSAVILVVVCTLVTGLLPALHASRANASGILAEASRASSRPQRSLQWLAGAEVAIAVLLLAGTFVLLTTFARLQQTRTGFDPENVLTFWVTPPVFKYPAESGPVILSKILEKVERVPGVQSAALNRCTPFGASCARTNLFQPGQSPNPQTAPTIGRHYVSAQYFRTLRIPLVAGRFLTEDDRIGRPPVAVVNETAARRFWPGQNPIGQHVWFGSVPLFMDPARPVEIVGVVGDVKYWPIDEPPGPDFYTSYLQFSYSDSVFSLRVSADASTVLPAIRRAVAEVDPDVPVWDLHSLDDVVKSALSRPRTNATIAALFALIAVALAGFGIFAVMAFAVAARRRELAIRIALGSTPARLRQLIFRDTSMIAAIGGLAGVGAAVLLLRLIRGFLYGVEPSDPVALGVALVAMIAVALAASVVPAFRASSTPTVEVLKQE